MPENFNDIELRSESVQEIMNKPPAWIIRWGITIVFTVLSMVLIASYFIKYPDKILSRVIIMSEQPSEKIYASKDGILEKVFVKNQEKITKGQILANFKSTADFNDIQNLKIILDTFQYNSNSFNFPIAATQNLRLGEIQSQHTLFERAFIQFRKNPNNISEFKILLESYDQLKIALADWEKNYLIKSSIDGKIWLDPNIIGNKITNSEDALFIILPQNTGKLFARLSISAQDQSEISPNQKVHIKLDNYSSGKFGVIEGFIKKVSTIPDSEGNYFADVSLPQGLKTTTGQVLQYNVDMNGNAEIITNDLRLIDRVLHQFSNLF